MLGRAVVRSVLEAIEGRAGADVHDATPRLRLHLRQERLRELQRCAEIDGEAEFEIIQPRLRYRTHREDPSAVDQDINLGKQLLRLNHQRRNRVLVGQVAGDRLDPDLQIFFSATLSVSFDALRLVAMPLHSCPASS